MSDAKAVGPNIDLLNKSALPEFGPFDTRVVQLKYTKPSDMVPILQQFTKTPGAILPIEGTGMLVLSDSAENVKSMLEMINLLDQTVTTDIESEVIPIKYALAADIANALNTLSGGGGGSVGGQAGGRGSMGTPRSTGLNGGRSVGGTTGYGGSTTGAGGIGGGASPLGNANAAPGAAAGSRGARASPTGLRKPGSTG